MTAQKFIKRGEKVHGPYSLNKIQSALDSGKVKSTDLISESSTGPWQSIQNFQEPLEQTPVVAVSNNAGANNPKLTTCSDCGATVSKRAEACPQCGAPLVEFEKSIDATGDPFLSVDLGSLPDTPQQFPQQQFPQQQFPQQQFPQQQFPQATHVGHNTIKAGQEPSPSENPSVPVVVWIFLLCFPPGLILGIIFRKQLAEALAKGPTASDRRVWAGGLLAISVLFLAGTARSDTSVSTVSGDRVHNIGLMQRQQNFMILGGIGCIAAGAWLAYEIKQKQSTPDTP